MLTPSIRLEDLPIGKFAKLNGSVIYRFSYSKGPYHWWMDGIWLIEKHNHLSIWDSESYVEADGIRHRYVTPIDSPQKKHVDNAISQLKNALKHKQIDNLSYLESLNTLQNYLKSGIIKEKKKEVKKRNA